MDYTSIEQAILKLAGETADPATVMELLQGIKETVKSGEDLNSQIAQQKSTIEELQKFNLKLYSLAGSKMEDQEPAKKETKINPDKSLDEIQKDILDQILVGAKNG